MVEPIRIDPREKVTGAARSTEDVLDLHRAAAAQWSFVGYRDFA